jgi:alkylhydroperoxidase family enzyme
VTKWYGIFLLAFGIIAGCSGGDEKATQSITPVVNSQRNIVRLDEPRIYPVVENDWTPAQRGYLKPHKRSGRLFNVFKTAANHPDMANGVDALAFGHVNGESSTLPPRHRELLILRIGWLCQSEYEWAAHSRVARSIGFTKDELLGITEGPDREGWTTFEATLIKAVDELHSNAFITDDTWQALSTQYNTKQLMDVITTVGTYNLVAMMLNSWGV